MERFLSPLRHQLPDIDIDVESARRTEVYEQILETYGGDRCTCVSMMDTYRARHGIRDVGAALGLPPGEIDALAKAFPHIRANQVRAAMSDLPELRDSGLARGENAGRTDLLLRLVERLDGLPRHIALHPCGVLLSDPTLLDRTPVESSWLGFPMSQFDKDDVEELGLLKLDVLGIRMQSAMAHAVQEVKRVDGDRRRRRRDRARRPRHLRAHPVDQDPRLLPDRVARPARAGRQVRAGDVRGPHHRHLAVPARAGQERHGAAVPRGPAGLAGTGIPPPDLEPALEQTYGVVVFHEQVLEIVATMTGCTLAEADEVRRALGDPQGQDEIRVWFVPTALGRGYDLEIVEKVWEVLKAFASFGFCKAHAAAFALPTYQSAWLKAHHPAAFLAGVLTHDPGMYPKRLILDDARQFGIAVLPLDVNASDADYRWRRSASSTSRRPRSSARRREAGPTTCGCPTAAATASGSGWPTSRASTRPRSPASSPAGPTRRCPTSGTAPRSPGRSPSGSSWPAAFDSLYGLGSTVPVRRRGR